MKRETVACLLFLLTAVLFVIAALVPVYRARPMNVTFITLAAFWLILALMMVAKARKRISSDGNHVH
jgi:uncharacterized membrane protein